MRQVPCGCWEVTLLEIVSESRVAILKPINAGAYRRLEEAGEDLLALHHLNVPNALDRSMLGTNAIENSVLNTRHDLGRVTVFEPRPTKLPAGSHKDLAQLIDAFEKQQSSTSAPNARGPFAVAYGSGDGKGPKW